MEYSELVENVASDLKLMLTIIDLFIDTYEIEGVEKIIENMKEKNSTLQAFPFPETMAKADKMIDQTKVFEAFLNLVKSRIEQRENLMNQSNETGGEAVLKALGMM